MAVECNIHCIGEIVLQINSQSRQNYKKYGKTL